MNFKHTFWASALVFLAAGCTSTPPEGAVTIDLAAKSAEVPSSMYGIFFEEINHSGDGGLYAELVQNRGFEDTTIPEGYTVRDGKLYPPALDNHLMGKPANPNQNFRWPAEEIPAWSLNQTAGKDASIALTSEKPLNAASPKALKVNLPEQGTVQVVNSGFWGMNIADSAKYNLRFNISKRDFEGTLTVKLLGEQGQELCNHPISLDASTDWVLYEGALTAAGSDHKGRLALEFKGKGNLLLDYVSLFPDETYHNRVNGLRKDVAETLEALNPAFVRWPGGCIVEGITLSNRFNWKETLGDPMTRPGYYNTWGYRATGGFGYHEFLLFCEDVNAKGMYVCNVGIGCQGRVGDACSDKDLDFYIQDALDAIDYAIGDGTTEWSRKRVESGHPEPFPLQYVEIGNENWGEVYAARYDKFYKVIKEKYPQLTLISTLGLGGQKQHEKCDMIDPHWYVAPDSFFANNTLFDQQERSDYEIYVGEYACNVGVGSGNMLGALGEAAFLTGMERNSDLVKMASYAPLLENVNDRVWPTNLIWVDSYRTMGRSSYHIQQMFGANRPTYNLATELTQPKNPVKIEGKIGVGTWNTDSEFRNVSFTTPEGKTFTSDFANNAADWAPQAGEWALTEGNYAPAGPGVMRWSVWNAPEVFGNGTIELEARKKGGSEGFIIYFGMNGSEGYVLNIGGWGNVNTAFQAMHGNDMPIIPGNLAQNIREGEWYKIRIEIADGDLTYYCNGEKLLNISVIQQRRYAISGYDEATGEVIVKVVNAEDKPFTTAFDLKNAKVESQGRIIKLAAATGTDENTLDEPGKIVPVESTYDNFGEKFNYTFEPWSFTVLRIKAKL